MIKYPVLLITFLLVASNAVAAPPVAQVDEQHRAFFRSYCVSCHRAEKTEGKLRLDDIPFVIDSVELADRWQKILNQLNSGDMPPEGEKQPAKTEKTEFLDMLARTLVTARKSIGDHGGEITMRRLNRREYKNTIRDLLGVEINVRELPADGGAGSFDTVGSSLFMSSDQLEQYLALGRLALDEHFARFVAPSGAKPRLVHVEAEERNARIAKSLAERTDAHERYLKWTAMVHAAAQKPENAAIAAQIRAEKKNDDRHFFSQWQRIKGAPSPAEFGFVDEIHADEQGRRNWVRSVPYQRAYLEHPATKTGAFLTIEDVFVNPYHPFRIPGGWPAGDYVVRVRIAATSNTPASRHFVEFGSQHNSGVRAVASSHQVTGTMEKPQVLEIPLKFSPEKGHGFFFQEKGTYESVDVAHRLFAEGQKANGIGPEFALWIDWIEVESATFGTASSVAANAPIKERREVELHANAMVGGTYNGYFKQGYEAAKKFMETKQPQKGIPDEQEAKFRIRGFEQVSATFERYLNDPLTKTGAYLTIYNVHTEEVITLPPDQPSGWLKTKHAIETAPPGEYMLRFRIGAVKGTPKERHFVVLGSRKEKDGFGLMQTFQISGTTEAPQIIEVPVSISADGPRTFVLREKRDVKLDHEIFMASQKATGVGPASALWIDWVEWEGPLVKQSPIVKTEHIEPESRRADVERGHLRYKFLNEQYAKWKAAGGDEAKLKDFGFTDKSHAEFAKVVWDGNNRWFQQYLDRPLSKTGLYLDNAVQETSEHAIDLPADIATGDYVMRVKIGRVPHMPAERAFLTFVEASPIDKDDRTFLANKQITATLDQPEVIELPFKVTPGGPRKFILMEKRPLKKEGISLPGRTRQIQDPKQRDPVLWIDWIEWQGPLLKQPAPPVKKHRYEPESKTADLKQKVASMNDNHTKFQKWKASGGKKEEVSKFGFQTDKQAELSELAWQGNHEWFQRYVDRPKAQTGMFVDNTINETSEFLVDLPKELATGDYVFRVKAGRVPDMPLDRAFLSLAQVNPIDGEARTFLASRQITADYDQPEIIEFPFRFVAGGSRRFIFAERRPLIRIDFALAGKTRLVNDPKKRDPVLWIDWIEYEGPLNTSDGTSKLEPVIFANATGASESDHARAMIDRFALRAFRGREPRPEYVDKLTKLFETRRRSGDAFADAIKEPLSVVLASSRFLYLAEPADEGRSRRLTDLELATRLAYFLWSAPPDDALLSLARSGDLQKPEILAVQVDRLIESEKSREFVTGFVHQWLDMDRLDFFQFNTQLYRDFDESTKAAARREVYLTFEHLLRNNDSLRSLLKSDFVIVNGLLAGYYGLDGVSGDEFRKVSLPHDSPRGGLLGMAAIMAMGSNGEQSSPVERGAWVLRKLLHDPPPPAPPNVPQITRLEGKLLTTRERLLAHQEEPQCASCHRKIDPIGFGLENFNAVGKWRTKDSYEKKGVGKKEWEIDSAGAFHKGPAFHDYFELRDLIAARAAVFARGFTEELIEYAIGRPYGFADDEMAAQIVARAKSKDFSLREFVQALVASEAFHRK